LKLFNNEISLSFLMYNFNLILFLSLFNSNLCTAKYERLGMDWSLKDFPLMTKDGMDDFVEFVKKIGVNNVRWSGLTKKID